MTFTANPDRGGTDIRIEDVEIGRGTRSEELDFTITTDQAKRYQIFQTMHTPLTNEKGDTLPRGAIKIFSPTSVLGTLRPKLPTDLQTGTSVVYTSNSAGAQDSFVLVFAVDLADPVPGGEYRSQITFTMEATDGGLSPVTVTRNIRLEMKPEFRISIRSATGAEVLDLGRITRNKLSTSGALTFTIESSLGEPYTVYQHLTSDLTGSEGQVIDAKAIIFRPVGAVGGRFMGGDESLTHAREPLFRSDEAGGAETFEVIYEAPDLSGARHGLYSGNLTFDVESESRFAFVRPINIPVRLEVEHIFYLDAEFEGARGLYFGELKHVGDMATRHALIKIHSNTGERYQVTQVVSRPMTNEEGREIDPSHFTFMAKGAKNGKILAGEEKPVKTGETVIFVSDEKGSPDEFTIEYQFTLPVDTRGGSYSSDVTYSLSSI